MAGRSPTGARGRWRPAPVQKWVAPRRLGDPGAAGGVGGAGRGGGGGGAVGGAGALVGGRVPGGPFSAGRARPVTAVGVRVPAAEGGVTVTPPAPFAAPMVGATAVTMGTAVATPE